METFASLRDYKVIRLNENKDRFIQKSTVLTDEQKQEVLDFFKSHANLEAKVNNGNWNYEIPYEEFKRVMDSVDTVEKRLKKQTKELEKQKGLESLGEGKDYSIIKDTPDYVAYKPLTHKGMRVIASNMVEPKLWCKSSVMKWSPKEILPKGEPMKGDLYPGAKWCVAMESDKHWRNYTHDGKSFIVVCRKQTNLPDNLKKLCAVIREGDIDWDQSVDASDNSVSKLGDSEVSTILESLLLKDPEVVLSEIQKYYDSSRKTYVISKDSDIPPSVFLKISPQLSYPVIWEGDFKVPRTVRSLEGCPDEVLGSFDCRRCSDLTSLKGAPRRVGREFTCSICMNLKSLEGAPEYIGSSFSCHTCPSLVSLKGVPRRITGAFNCINCKSLTSLEGAPEYVGGDFECTECCSLISLEGAPKKVIGTFKCTKCTSLVSLEGAPEHVGGDFRCDYCKNLKSLKGAPRRVGKHFSCISCESLISLEGAPEYVGGAFRCDYCKSLKSLGGTSEHIGGGLYCISCPNLNSTEGVPKGVTVWKF